ncbi:hypothetical protein AU252_12035 [Pseudarthrobacter sulfonivorans]|uniref:Uncharacterized protein n=1 Tax=Pseudarthrobacter sulfonivorans TaxID=121292 RepID=A0A0U3R9C1_9MICC|nr:hypothetical protein [Pseudarthrobacter sulfonivorans]ALV41793.1 hypothetical protein AU252_12035 [Pseudarthrobacter sulfonivorans]
MSLAPLHDPSIASAPASPKAHGSGEGTASLAFSLIAPASMFLTVPFSLLAAFFTRPSERPGRLDWVAPLVLWSYPALFGLLAVTLGIVSLRVFVRRSNGWRAGVAALWISAAEVAVGLVLVLRDGDFMILF